MKFFQTYREAKKHLKEVERRRERRGLASSTELKIYDLKKSHPRRVKTRYMVGNDYDWLSL